jgi:adenosylcobinamide-GDP ribazoletransferase
VRGLLEAVRYLTILPVGHRGGDPGGGPGSGAAWFPVVGLVMGGVLTGVDQLASRIFPPLLAALLTLTAWKLLTGGLHLDGLADCLDAAGGRDAAHRLAIMRDSRIGAFGALGLILLLLLELAALAELAPTRRWRALLVVPAVGRAMPVVLARLFAPARDEGHGARFAALVRPRAVGLALVVALAAAVAVLGAAGAVAVGAATLAAVGFAAWLAARLGGITGDVHGGAVELGELTALLAIVAWTRALL